MSEEEKNIARSKGGKTSGSIAYKNKTGIHSLTKEDKKRIGKKGGLASSSQKWRCLITGYISTAPGLASYQRKRNIDTSLKVRVS
jgi:hypothetical protein